MFLNVSGVPQGLQNKFLDYKTVSPREIISENVFPDVTLLTRQFKKIKKINFKDVNSILLRRGHALGDIVMTFPIVNYFKKLGKSVSVYTNTKYAIPGVDFILDSAKARPQDFDLIIDLDWVLERDHYEPKYFKVNRVDIYREYMGLRNIGNDWSVEFTDVDVDVEDAVIAVQLKGSTAAKDTNIKPLLDELENRNIKFYVVDDISAYGSGYKNAVVKPTNVIGLLNIFKRLKGVINFDSGPLWLSHVTNIPSFTITGPTYGGKLIKRHPNNKTVYYDTRVDYGCRLKYGCGENAKLCHGKYSCMRNIDYKRLNNEFFSWLEGL